MLLVTNGDSAAEQIERAGLAGVILPWRDVLHEGPVPAGLSARELGLTPGKDGDYVWAGERRGTTCLVPEALYKLEVLCEVVLEELEGHGPIQHLVVGQVDIRHPSTARQLSELVSLVDENLIRDANHTP